MGVAIMSSSFLFLLGKWDYLQLNTMNYYQCVDWICLCVCSVPQFCLTLCDPMECKPFRLLCPWDVSGKNSGMGCHFLLQGIYPAQAFKPFSSSMFIYNLFITSGNKIMDKLVRVSLHNVLTSLWFF